MHVDWRWIRQRPHVFAEELASTSDVLVLYRLNPKRASLPQNASVVRRLPFLPLGSSWGRMAVRLDSTVQRGWIRVVASLFRPDVVWITHPLLYTYLPNSLRGAPVIYDCMDDAEAMARDSDHLLRIRGAERHLVERASAVLCSSAALIEKLRSRYGVFRQASLVRNGLSEEWLARSVDAAAAAEGGPTRLRVAYVGTIAAWLDFDLLLTCLKRISNLEIHLVGPVSGVRPPLHPRLLLTGPVEHEQLRRRMATYGGFLLPFLIDSTTEAVDPVKLYEYLSCGREVIATWYPEIARFEPYVHFCRSADDATSLLKQLEAGTLTKKAELSTTFLGRNTWQERGKEIRRILDQVLGGKRSGARDFGDRR